MIDDDVALVRWPTDEDRRLHLAGRGALRLLLVTADADPPLCDDPREDWIRLPAPDEDVRARAAALVSAERRLSPSHPTIDDHGTLRYRSRQTELSPQQVLLMQPLVERFGLVVSRTKLERSVWPGSAPGEHDLDVPIMRLRRRLTDVGLRVRSVRSRGYLLEATASDE